MLKKITSHEEPERGLKNSLSYRAYLLPVLCLTAIFCLNFVSRIILSPMITAVESDLDMSHGKAGSLFFLVTMGYFISLIGSGYVNSKVTHRVTVIFSSVFVGLVMIGISFTRTSFGLSAGMFLVGIGAGAYLPSGIASITHIVDSRQWGKALAIHEMAPNLAFLSVPFMVEVLFLWFSWREVEAIIGIMAIAVGVLYAILGRGGEFSGEVPNYSSVTILFRNPSFVIMIFLLSLGIASSIGLFTMLPLYLVDQCGLTRTHANTVVGLSRITPLALVFIGGWTTDRFGAARTIKWVFLITGTITIFLGIVPSNMISVIVFLQPVVAIWFFPAFFALLSSIVPSQSRSLAVSFSTPIAFLAGGGIVPMAIGTMADMNLFPLAMSLVGVFVVSGGLIL
ncbi:MAG: MFS transporter, partial [Deltaproteobacteria bacterium]|nr:MFS transporter [Deltaproteobacteria bacterium]